jgi:hypothetical protein
MPDPQEQANDIPPLLAVAVICEKSLMEQDNSPSLVRIVDTIHVALAPTAKPGDTIQLDLIMFVMFRCGDARGPRKYQVWATSPSGGRGLSGEMEGNFPGPPEMGIIFRAPELSFPWDKEGRYSFEIHLNGVVQTKIPLNVVVDQTGGPPRATSI